MTNPHSRPSLPRTQLIDAKIEELGDWRAALIRAAVSLNESSSR